MMSYIYPLEYKDVWFLKQNNPQQVTCFDSLGKLKYRIHNQGRGPAEYDGLSEIAVNSYVPEFYILEPLNCMDIYDMQGQFQEKITFPFKHGIQTGIFPLNRDTLIIVSGHSDQTISFFSLKEKRLIAQHYDPMPSTHHPFYWSGEELYHYNWYEPVVYKVQDTSFTPAYAFDFGKDANPREYYEDADRILLNKKAGEEAFLEKFNLVIHTIKANSEYLYMILINSKEETQEARCIWYGKQSGKCVIMKNFRERIPLSTFDILTDEYLMTWLSASQKESLDPDLLDKKNREIYESIQAEDNPFLVLYRF